MSEAVATEMRGAPPATIHALTGIRAIAAVWVVVEHFRYELYGLFPAAQRVDWWIDSGYLGVEVFFVLSGFIISYNYAGGFSAVATRRSYGEFLLNRFARIYPVHLVTLMAVALLVLAASVTGIILSSDGKYTPLSFVANVGLFQVAPGVAAWNGPAWSISVEALAYVAFPLVALWLAKFVRPRSAALAATCWLLAGTGLMMAVREVSSSPTSPGMALLRIATEFVAGALLWKAWSLAQEPQSPRWDVVAGAAFLLTVGCLAALPDGEGLGLLTTPIIAVFVIACAGAVGPIGRLLSSGPMIFGGKISYSLYMVHFIVLMMAGKLAPWENYDDSSVVVRVGLLAAYYLTCLLAAMACYFLVEEPARKAIRSATSRRVR